MEIVGGERETSWPTLDGSSLSLSSSSRYPFFIERSIVEPDPVLQTDLSLPGWEKSVVVVVSLDLVEEARYTHCRPVIDDQKQGGCYKARMLVVVGSKHLPVSWKPSNGMDLLENVTEEKEKEDLGDDGSE